MTKKTRFIEKLPSLSVFEKETAVAFFSKYPLYESCIDWNNQFLTYKDFEKVFLKAENSRAGIRHRAKTNPEILFEKYNCRIVHKAENFLIIMPLDWKAAIFINSFNCGGTGAKWCIGDKNDFWFWNKYIESEDLLYLVFFSEIHPVWEKKILLFYNRRWNMFTTWLQNDKRIDGIAPIFDTICRDDIKVLCNTKQEHRLPGREFP